MEVQGRSVSSGSDNLIHRAAKLLSERTGVQRGLRIKLQKRIPLGAGLGGGSGNAATTLLALNQLWECRLTPDELLGLAGELGSDVPFFFLGGTVIASGRGESIASFAEPPAASIIVVYPALELTAKEAYALGNWGSWEETGVLTTQESETRINRLRRAIEKHEKPWTYLENDFEGPILTRYPALTEIREALQQAGCSQTLLCGSGSALFGLTGARQAESVAETISKRKPGEVFLCRTLSRKQYWKRLKRLKG